MPIITSSRPKPEINVRGKKKKRFQKQNEMISSSTSRWKNEFHEIQNMNTFKQRSIQVKTTNDDDDFEFVTLLILPFQVTV